MKRREFIHKAGLSILPFTMNTQRLHETIEQFNNSPKMPALFIGHGSPMNAIEKNAFTQKLNQLGSNLPIPQAILVISAHWQTKGTYVHISDKPNTIHDFGGFPKALFDVQYPAAGSPTFAKLVASETQTTQILHDSDWGLDHGAWSILNQLFPNASIPVFQMSLDYNADPNFHYQLGKELDKFRNKGVMIIGSGNIVHNLGKLNWQDPNPKPFDWAIEFDELVKLKLQNKDHRGLIEYGKIGQSAALSIPTNEHYLPMLYAAAMQQSNENITFLYEQIEMSSISMRSFMIQ